MTTKERNMFLFAYDNYYAGGGLNDFVGIFSSVNTATKFVISRKMYEGDASGSNIFIAQRIGNEMVYTHTWDYDTGAFRHYPQTDEDRKLSDGTKGCKITEFMQCPTCGEKVNHASNIRYGKPSEWHIVCMDCNGECREYPIAATAIEDAIDTIEQEANE